LSFTSVLAKEVWGRIQAWPAGLVEVPDQEQEVMEWWRKLANLPMPKEDKAHQSHCSDVQSLEVVFLQIKCSISRSRFS
jgi:hypothetical protein